MARRLATKCRAPGSGAAVLSVPQWWGAGHLEADAAAAATAGAACSYRAMRRALPSVRATELSLPSSSHTAPVSRVKHHALLAKVLEAQAAELSSLRPSQVWTAGGDCSIDLACMSYLQARYSGRLCVAYIDAHADLNAEHETTSGHFHGMSLRAALGDAPAGLRPPFSELRAEQLLLAGARDLDAAEEEFIKSQDIACINIAALKAEPCRASQALAGTHADSVLHVHLDLDVLDPAAFPHVNVPTPGGLQLEELLQVLRSLAQAYDGRLCGATVTEFRLREAAMTPDAAEDVLVQLLGPRGLDLAGQTERWQGER